MPINRYEGQPKADGNIQIAIVLSRFNETIGKNLLEGALGALASHGLSDDQITLVSVPGALEIPLVAQELAKRRKYSAIITLGAVIRGETTHHEHVGGQAAAGLTQVALATGVPIAFGVLTTETVEQAVERADVNAGNKGASAALAALEMADLLKKIRA